MGKMNKKTMKNSNKNLHQVMIENLPKGSRLRKQLENSTDEKSDSRTFRVIFNRNK